MQCRVLDSCSSLGLWIMSLAPRLRRQDATYWPSGGRTQGRPPHGIAAARRPDRHELPAAQSCVSREASSRPSTLRRDVGNECRRAAESSDAARRRGRTTWSQASTDQLAAGTGPGRSSSLSRVLSLGVAKPFPGLDERLRSSAASSSRNGAKSSRSQDPPSLPQPVRHRTNDRPARMVSDFSR